MHIGFGKTGTSSIQKYLSTHGIEKVAGTDLVYCAWTPAGEFLHGPSAGEAATRTPLGYLSSTPVVPPSLEGLARGIAEIHQAGLTPVLSQEDWARNGAEFISAFEAMGLSLRVIAYVRPQIEWFNAGWWQWWAWEGAFSTPSDVIDAWGTNFLLWSSQLEKWARSEAVKDIDVRLHCDDVVADFLQLFGAQPASEPERSNSGIDPLLVALYQAFPTLRKTHSSETDLVLSSLLNRNERSPWVVSCELAEKIAAATNSDNLSLLQRISPEQQEMMKTDARWWEASAYADRFSMPYSGGPLSRSDASKLLEAIVPAFLEEKLSAYADGA